MVDPTQIKAFLDGGKDLANDPFLLPDMHHAVSRVYRALLSGENIAVYGDYDVDGITATALLVQGLTALGGKVIPYIPHRLTEGYGLKTAALENLQSQGISLVISVDCGITSLPQVKRAQKKKLDIVITDHHTPLDEVPPAVAVVDPKLPGSVYPFRGLSGVGVAFKLLQALFQSIGKGEQSDKLMDLVALGTIADISALLGENRYFVKEGLKLINSAPRLGINELVNQVELNPGDIDAEKISWLIAPCLNAAGRMAHALTSYNLLMTESTGEAHELAIWLDRKNAERQSLTASAFAQAREQAITQGISHLLMVSGSDYHPGISGLVASRLVEEFYRPAIVVKVGETMSSGSCRSIPEFNMIAALTQCSRLFSQFGGHSQAAGFTLPTKNLPRLKQRLSELAAAQLEGIELRPRLDIDVQVVLSELGGDTFKTTRQLAPFGQGNPAPTFLSRKAEVIDCHTMGGNGDHLKLKLRQQGTVWDAVGFRLGKHSADLSRFLDIVYNLEVERWCGQDRFRLNILDFAKAG